MSTLPALEAALDEAAHRHYGRRPRRRLHVPWRRMLAPALVVACALLAALVVVPGAESPPAQAPPEPPVPAATLTLSRELTQAPALSEPRSADQAIEHSRLPAVADSFERRTPYPPGLRDTFDWASTAPGPTDMASINVARDVEGLVEFRAACIWLRYWLSSGVDGRQAAATVLSDVPDWPSMRDGAGNWARAGKLAAADDALGLQEINRTDCTPWSDRQGG